MQEVETYTENANLLEKLEVNPEELAALLTQLRQEKGFTQATLARLAGCTTRTIQTFEAGGDVSDALKKRIANALGRELRAIYVLAPKK